MNKPAREDIKLITQAPSVIDTSVNVSEDSAKIGIFFIINSFSSLLYADTINI